MKEKTGNLIRKICVVLGIIMLASACVLLLTNLGSQKRSETYVNQLRLLMPQPQGAVPEERTDNTMAALSLDGVDFVGILEMPRYGAALPVGAQWGKSHQYPCCLSGSVHDGSIQIGTTSRKGQFDFYREISVGDSIYFTDTSGSRYSYTVTDLRYESHADQDALTRHDADLTLFIKNIYGFEYIILFCDV